MSDYILYYNTVCPFSRKVAFMLDEFGIEYKSIDTKIWRIEPEFLNISPSNEIPVLIDLNNEYIVNDSYVIIDYLDNINNFVFTESGYFGINIFEKSEVQRLQMWFDKKFFNEVTKIITEEVFYKTFENNDEVPNSNRIEIFRCNLNSHIKYMQDILSIRKWLGCEKFTIADVSAASHISILDYIGYINWKKYPRLKEWYIVVKSKKGFEKILKERIGSFIPSLNYNKYDF